MKLRGGITILICDWNPRSGFTLENHGKADDPAGPFKGRYIFREILLLNFGGITVYFFQFRQQKGPSTLSLSIEMPSLLLKGSFKRIGRYHLKKFSPTSQLLKKKGGKVKYIPCDNPCVS